MAALFVGVLLQRATPVSRFPLSLSVPVPRWRHLDLSANTHLGTVDVRPHRSAPEVAYIHMSTLSPMQRHVRNDRSPVAAELLGEASSAGSRS
jgi:hypothetical protein